MINPLVFIALAVVAYGLMSLTVVRIVPVVISMARCRFAPASMLCIG